jgi:spermidine synthase
MLWRMPRRAGRDRKGRGAAGPSVQVVAADGGRRRMLVDGLEAAVVDRADPTHLDFPYMRWIADLLDVGWRAGAPLRAVHVGAGGCVLPRYLAATRPGSHSEAFESDPAVLEALSTVLDLRAEPGLRLSLGDGRALLAGRPARSADVVVTDAFSGPVVPAHLTTIEYQAELRRILRTGGVHLMNVIDAPPGRAARRQAATLLEAFAEVVLIAPRGVVGGRRTGNVVFAAADRTLSLARLRARARDNHEVLAPAEVAVLADGAAILRDR